MWSILRPGLGYAEVRFKISLQQFVTKNTNISSDLCICESVHFVVVTVWCSSVDIGIKVRKH